MQENRYSRQLDCTEGFSQQSLIDASIIVAGIGGLGSITSILLAAAGVGTICLFDFDIISITNLNRQILYTQADLGKFKVYVAEKKLKKINPNSKIITIPRKISLNEASSIKKPTLILDCLDSFQSRIELIRIASSLNIPLIHAAAHGFYGQLSTYIPNKTSCPMCPVTHFETEKQTSLSIGACVSTIASLQSIEAIKYISDVGILHTNKLMRYDMLKNKKDYIEIIKSDTCVACVNQS